jgi:NADH:ubiquinone oxidoreductase subunit 6 (subunit J)
MPGQVTLFILAGTAMLGSVLMISRSKALHSTCFFALTLLATTGIFLQLHAPLLLAAQFVAIACVLLGIILFAVDIARLDLALAAEYSWIPNAAAVIVALSLLVQIGLTILQRRQLPGESLTELLPRASLPWPLSLGELTKFFFDNDLLPLGLLVCVLLVGITGIGVLFQKRT